jgi:hypothetical protein
MRLGCSFNVFPNNPPAWTRPLDIRKVQTLLARQAPG